MGCTQIRFGPTSDTIREHGNTGLHRPIKGGLGCGGATGRVWKPWWEMKSHVAVGGESPRLSTWMEANCVMWQFRRVKLAAGPNCCSYGAVLDFIL